VSGPLNTVVPEEAYQHKKNLMGYIYKMLKNRTITADNDKVIADHKSSHELITEKTEENVKLGEDYKELEMLIGDFFQDYALNSLVGLWKNEAFT
jgi:hypothetical protein